ncbi:SWIM zinc finger family protein [soil metagenome]
MGGDRYVTTVALSPGRKHPSLESACTCPVGFNGCKHAVAVVAEYLQALADGHDVPVADEDDPRWTKLDSNRAETDDDWDEDDEDEASWEDEDQDETAEPVRRARSLKKPPSRQASAVHWDDKIEQHLRAKSQGELADLVWSLVRRFPEIYQEFRERIALQEGDVGRLVAEARREIRQVTSETAWRNDWNGEGHIPNYSKIQHRFERLLELGHADDVVSLGREFIAQGLRQVGEAHDEGDTALAFAECLPVIFQAVTRSSLSGPERLLFAIDAELADDYDALGGLTEAIFDAPVQPEDWSVVADTLAQRLKTSSTQQERGAADSFSRNYARDRVTNWVARALENAGRDQELRILYVTEARASGSYERLVRFLLEQEHFEDAEQWAREGIAETIAKLPGIAASLADNLCELARQRKHWDVVAAHVAFKFFSEYPSTCKFDDLMKATQQAGVEEPVRAAALRFLETGAMPYQVIVPPPKATTGNRTRSKVKKRGAANSSKTKPTVESPEPTSAASVELKNEPQWPLPIPDYLIPLLNRPGQYNPTPRPHLEVLLEMALAAKNPDEVLQWFDKMQPAPRGPGYNQWPYGSSYSDRVAEAVSAPHPERAIAIYTDALNAHLPHAQQSSYESATAYLRKLRPLFESLNRASEWTALVASIREKYRNRPRFMDQLDGLEGQSIVQSARTRRK